MLLCLATTRSLFVSVIPAFLLNAGLPKTVGDKARFIPKVKENHTVPSVAVEDGPSPPEHLLRFIIAVPHNFDGGLAISLRESAVHLPTVEPSTPIRYIPGDDGLPDLRFENENGLASISLRSLISSPKKPKYREAQYG